MHSILVFVHLKDPNTERVVCDLLMATIDELREEIITAKKNSDAIINELKQQKMVLQEKLETKHRAELSVVKSDNLRLKSDLMDKICELEKLRTKLSSGQHKHAQTTGFIELCETKEEQFMDSLTEFAWIEKLLMENIADSERICAESVAKEATVRKCVEVDAKPKT